MPILMSLDQLEPGMQLAANVVNGFSVLLPHGRELNESDIRALRRKFPHLSVQVYDPLLDEAVEFDDTRHDAEVSMEVRKNISNVTRKVSAAVRSGVAIDSKQLQGMESVVNNMMSYLEENPVTVAIMEQSRNWDDYLQEHSANVFYLSMLLGNTIRNYIKVERERLSAAKVIHNAMNLTPLATAAMFHDIAMSPLNHIYGKEEPLTPAEKKAIREHPLAGAEMLPDSINPMVKLAVRCHHENQDGSGYPNGLAGDKITIFARILRIADAYSAAISQSVYREAKLPVAVLHEMVYGDYRRCYDPIVLKVFSGIVQPLPIGAKLRLTNGQTAVLVKHNHKDCFNPVLIIAYDEFGDPIPKESLEAPFALKTRNDIKVSTFTNHDISFLNTISASKPSEEAEVSGKIERLYDELFEYAYP